MADLSAILKAAGKETDTGLHIDALAALVESQVSNVIGGGYSQYYVWHNKDAQ